MLKAKIQADYKRPCTWVCVQVIKACGWIDGVISRRIGIYFRIKSGTPGNSKHIIDATIQAKIHYSAFDVNDLGNVYPKTSVFKRRNEPSSIPKVETPITSWY